MYGENNIAIGAHALSNQKTGMYNIAVGNQSCLNMQTGDRNVVIGTAAGQDLNGTDRVTLLGHNTFATGALYNATAIGAGAEVGSSNSVVLGRTDPAPQTDSVRVIPISSALDYVGIGTTTPQAALHVHGNIINCMNVTPTVATNYYMQNTDSIVIAAGANPQYIYLPRTDSLVPGQIFQIISGGAWGYRLGVQEPGVTTSRWFYAGISTTTTQPRITNSSGGGLIQSGSSMTILYYPTNEIPNGSSPPHIELMTHFWILSVA
jgi:hypothetical protein